MNVWYKSHATCDSISLQIDNTVRLLIQLRNNIYYALYKDSPVFTVRIYNHLSMAAKLPDYTNEIFTRLNKIQLLSTARPTDN